MFELLKKVIEKNPPQLKRFRFKGKRGMATDQVTVVCWEDVIFDGLDCLVESDSFSKYLEGYKGDLRITQQDHKSTETINGVEITKVISSELIFSSGESAESKLGTEPITSLMNIDQVPDGDGVEVGNFLEAIEAIKGFAEDVVYITGGYLYATGGNDSTVLRTPISTAFSSTVFLNAAVVNLLLAAKKAVIGIVESEKKLTFIFDDGWIETGKPNWALPANLSEFFTGFEKLALVPLEPMFSRELKRICSFGDKDDFIDFDETGVQMNQGLSKKHRISKPMPSHRMRAIHLKPVLAIDPSFDFTSAKDRIAFKTEKLSGFIAGMMKQ